MKEKSVKSAILVIRGWGGGGGGAGATSIFALVPSSEYQRKEQETH